VDPQKIPGKTTTIFFPFETAEQYLNDDRKFMEKGHPEEKRKRFPATEKRGWSR